MSEPEQQANGGGPPPEEDEGTVVEIADGWEHGWWGKTYDEEDYSVAGVAGGDS